MVDQNRENLTPDNSFEAPRFETEESEMSPSVPETTEGEASELDQETEGVQNEAIADHKTSVMEDGAAEYKAAHTEAREAADEVLASREEQITDKIINHGGDSTAEAKKLMDMLNGE